MKWLNEVDNGYQKVKGFINKQYVSYNNFADLKKNNWI